VGKPANGAVTSRLPAGHRLLRGTAGDAERRARRRLVRELLAAGLSEAEIDRAIDEDRLALLPAEVVLTGRRRYSDGALARQTGVSAGALAEFSRASGLAVEPEQITARHLRIAESLRQVLDAGIDREALVEVARVTGQSLATVARVIVRVVGETYLRKGDSEYDVGARYAEVAATLLPVLNRLLEDELRLHLLAELRRESLGREERASGSIPVQREMSVAFADLAGFTRLGSRVHADQVGRVASRLVELTGEVIEPPVAMVKSVGDAVMLVSPDPERLVADVLTLVERVGEEGEDFPELRAGIAHGPVVRTGGDLYGHTVNLASRLTSIARPGTVVATADVRARTRGRIIWSRSLPRHLRGMRGAVVIAKARAVQA